MGLGDLIDRITNRSKINELEQQVFSLQMKERRRTVHSSGPEYSFGQFEREYADALTGDKKWDTLKKMRSDAHVDAALRGMALPLLNAEWEITPASEDERDVEIAEFVSANLLGMGGDRFDSDYWCQSPWNQRLGEILSFLEDGFSLFTYSTRRVGTKVVFDKIQWLEPSTVDPRGWMVDDEDNFLGVKRTFQSPQARFRAQEPVPASDLLLYPWEFKGARFDGRPWLRSLFGAWSRKDFILRQAVIWAQKAGAPVPMGFYPTSYSAEERNAFIDGVKALRNSTQPEAFLAAPLGKDGAKPEVGYAGADSGEVDRSRGLIDGENQEIGVGGNRHSQVLGGGSNPSGSRAVGDVQAPVEMLGVQALARVIGSLELYGPGNMEGPIKLLVDRNYRGVKKYPRPACSKIDPHEATARHDATEKLWKAGILPHHEDIRRQVAEALGYNLPDEAYEIQEPPVAPSPPGQGAGGENDEPGSDDTGRPPNVPRAGDGDDEGAFSLAARPPAATRKRIEELLKPTQEGRPRGGGFRHPNQLEFQYVSLGTIEATFRAGERDVLQVLRDARAAMTRELMGRVRSGKITTRNLASQRQSRFRGQGRWVGRLFRRLESTGGDAAAEVENEIERQREDLRR